MNLKNRNFLTLLDFSPEEISYLLELSATLKKAKYEGSEKQYLKNKNIVLIFEKTSTRTRCAFEVACYDQGANVTFLGPSESQIGHKETMKDTARVLGRMYNGIEYRGFDQEVLEELAKYSGVPVWNGLTDKFHPTQVLADLLTIQEFPGKPLSKIKLCYFGDARNNMANSLMTGASKMGMDFRAAAPLNYMPSKEMQKKCSLIAKKTGAKILLTDKVEDAVRGCDIIYTDVWVSMGEPEGLWNERIELLKPYQVNETVMEMTGNPHVKFMHCLPALHNAKTNLGQKIFKKFGITSMEVTEKVFEGNTSVVFDQAENRLHTIKAIMVATLS